MRQLLVVLALVLGMVWVGPVWASEFYSPPSPASWISSVWESLVSFWSCSEKDTEVDQVGLTKETALDHGPGLEPGGFLEETNPHPELEHGPGIDPGG